MHKTLLRLCALSMAALAHSHCNESSTAGDSPDMAAPTDDLSVTADFGSIADDLSTPPDLAPTVDTDFFVLRIGAGAATLTNDATPGFIERRRIADGALVGQALALPIAVNGSNRQITFSGVATVEGQLSRSSNGKYVVVAGYAANPGVNNISTSNAMTNNRVIATIDAAGNVNTTTAFNGFSGTAIRGAASTDGMMLWATSDTGVGYTTLGSTTAPLILNVVNLRGIAIFPLGGMNQVLASSAGSTTYGVNAVGTGTPMAATTVTALTGFNATNSPAPYGFMGFDRDGNGSVDQFYVADDRTAGGGGLQRWKLNGTSWMLEGTIALGTSAGARAVTGTVANNTATLIVTTAETGTAMPRIVKLTDSGGTTAQVAATLQVLATAAANTTYRGVALAPIP